MKSKNKNSFLVYYDQKNLVDELSDTEAGELFKLILSYAQNGTAPTKEITAKISNPGIRMAFVAIKTSMDRDSEKYDAKCKANSEYGKLGGRPKKRTVNLKADG